MLTLAPSDGDGEMRGRSSRFRNNLELAELARAAASAIARLFARCDSQRRLGEPVELSRQYSSGCDWKWVRGCRLKPAFRPQWNAGFSRQPRSAHSHLTTPYSSGRFGWLSLVPPHPRPLPQGEGTPHPARRRVEALWIGECAADDSPSPVGRAGVRGFPGLLA
jgi:hypothetical protein